MRGRGAGRGDSNIHLWNLAERRPGGKPRTFIFGGGRPGGKARTFIFGGPGPAFLGAQNRGNRENYPKTQYFGKIASFGVISPIFTPFREKGQKCPKWPPGGAPREKSDSSCCF